MEINKLPEGEDVITLEYGRLRQDMRCKRRCVRFQNKIFDIIHPELFPTSCVFLRLHR